MQYAEQLERKSQPAFHPSEDGQDTHSRFASRVAEACFSAADFPPDHIDDLVLELEDAKDGREIIRNLTPIEAGWLARAARDKCRRDEELMPEYIERDLNVNTSAVCVVYPSDTISHHHSIHALHGTYEASV